MSLVEQFNYFHRSRTLPKTRYPEFSEALAIAAAEYRMTLPNDAIARAKEALNTYLYNGDIQTWTSREIYKDPDGNIVKTVERVTKQVKGTPPWVIDRVLGKSFDELESIRTLVEAEWLPREILYSCGASMEKLKTEMQRRFRHLVKNTEDRSSS